MENTKDKVLDAFRAAYGGDGRMFRAPGRVNFIGDHTDYNGGFVMPFAIDRETVTVGRARQDSMLNIVALDLNRQAAIDLSTPAVRHRRTWVDYVEGTARSLKNKFGTIGGADMVFASSVPIGAGLSSSAALETSVGYAMLALSEIDIDREKLAFAAQSAEHDFVGIRSGIMDQFASVFGKAGHAMLLDCRSLQIVQIPLSIQGVMIAVCDSGVKHRLASTEYNVRREQCETGVRLLSEKLPGIESLRDVSWPDLEKFGGALPDVIYRRCRHVITENQRTLAAAEAMKSSDAVAAGRLMKGSHRSLRDDYEVSCAEIDELVATASGVDGVYGARLTGGGFGGCTVNLLRTDVFERFTAVVSSAYKNRFGSEPEIYVFRSDDGACEINT